MMMMMMMITKGSAKGDLREIQYDWKCLCKSGPVKWKLKSVHF